MPRPKNLNPTIPISFAATPKLAAYIDRLIAKERYGNSRGGVARNLVWRMIEDLLSKRLLDEIPDSDAPDASQGDI